MASASDERVFSMHELKDALLACSVCKESENELGEMLQLKIMNCHHTVCIECLYHIIDGQPNFSCPECRQVMAVPAEGVQGIQNNFLAAQVQDFANRCKIIKKDVVAEAIGTRCGRCEEMVEIVKHQCVYCGHLCSACKWQHYDSKSLRHHNVFTIPSKASDNKITVSEFCTKHNLSHITLFCTRCQVAICKMCKELNHNDHRQLVTSISQVAMDNLTEIEVLLESVTKCQAQVCLMFRNIRQAEEKVKAETNQTKNEISTFFQKCHVILSQRELELFGSVEHHSKKHQKLLLYWKEFAQDIHIKLGSSLEYAEQIKKLPHSLAVITAAKALKPALLDLAMTDIDTNVTCRHVPFITAQNLLSDIESFQCLVSFIGKAD